MKRTTVRIWIGVALAVVALAAATALPRGERPFTWSDDELRLMRGLSVETLPPFPPDPTNRYADNPAAAELGKRLFFDTRLSSNGKVSCATCHQPDRDFQDGVPLGVGVGTTPRRTMPIAGTAYSSWMFWDGRKDSQWSQALGPLESPVEHGGSRLQYAHAIDAHYRAAYESIFGPMPDLSSLPPTGGPVADSLARARWERLSAADREAVSRVFVNMGKAIAAYERTIRFAPARFDRYVSSLDQQTIPPEARLTADELAGLRLFMGKAQCVNCHNGPLFTDNDFHNTGVAARSSLPEDVGRAAGVTQVLDDEFNCLSPYSDAAEGDCAELRYMIVDEAVLMRAYKTPSLRNVADRGPYMHAGQIERLRDVLAHYNAAPAAPAGHSEVRPLELTDVEMGQLEAFLRTLTGPVEERFGEAVAMSARPTP